MCLWMGKDDIWGARFRLQAMPGGLQGAGCCWKHTLKAGEKVYWCTAVLQLEELEPSWWCSSSVWITKCTSLGSTPTCTSSGWTTSSLTRRSSPSCLSHCAHHHEVTALSSSSEETTICLHLNKVSQIEWNLFFKLWIWFDLIVAFLDSAFC